MRDVIRTLLLLMAAAFCSGCMMYVPATMHLQGSVLDAASKKPIAGARVVVRGHPKTAAMTGSDGAFDLPPEMRWLFVPVIIPLDYLPDGRLDVSARSYQPATMGGWYGKKDIFLKPEPKHR